jgi:O-acetyl-ADP-ribose deacetylase (regulator of RNase III)
VERKDKYSSNFSMASISIGVYGCPFAEACKITITEIQSFMNECDNHIKVTLVTHPQKDFDIYSSIYGDFK